jgi:hypothetical protein
MRLGCFMSSYLKEHEILNSLRGSFLSLKNPNPKFVMKIISDAFAIILPTFSIFRSENQFFTQYKHATSKKV